MHLEALLGQLSKHRMQLSVLSIREMLGAPVSIHDIPFDPRNVLDTCLQESLLSCWNVCQSLMILAFSLKELLPCVVRCPRDPLAQRPL